MNTSHLPSKQRNGVLQSLFPDEDVSVIEGEFAQDEPPNEDGTLQLDESVQYLNEGPQGIRQMLADTDCPHQKRVLEKALHYWGEFEHREFETGEPYRGEPREAIQASSLRELVGTPVEHIMVGDLSAMTVLPEGEMADPDSLEWLGIIDFDFLVDPNSVV
jgi:hypothetical protein